MQFDRGVFSVMGSVDPESFDTLHSYANAFEMPFLTPWYMTRKNIFLLCINFEMPIRYIFRFPESLYGLSGAAGEAKEGSDTSLTSSSSSDSSASSEFAFQIRPDYHEGLVDIITHYGWEKIIYVYRLEKTSFSIWEKCFTTVP